MAFKRLNTSDRLLNQVQDNIDTALIPIQSSPFVGGILLKNVSLISGQDNLVQHMLGRAPIIYVTCIPNVSSTIWSPTTSSLNNSNVSSTYLNLRCSSSCTVSIWVN